MFKRGIWLAVLAACFVIGSAQADYWFVNDTFTDTMECDATLTEIKELCVDTLQCAACCTCIGCQPYLEIESGWEGWVSETNALFDYVECFQWTNCVEFEVVFTVPDTATVCGMREFEIYAMGLVASADTCSLAVVDTQTVQLTLEDNENPTIECIIDWENSADHLGTRSGPTGDTLVLRGGAAESFPNAQCNGDQAEALLAYSCSTTDNCASRCSCTPPSPHYFSVLNNGTPGQRFICMATDSCQNTAACTFYVWVDTLEIPCNKIDDDCDGDGLSGYDEGDPSCYEFVYVDDDWTPCVAGSLLGIGFDGWEVRYLCNAFDNLMDAYNAVCATQIWVHPGVYDIDPAPLAINKYGLEMYSFQGAEVTIISCGCNALQIESDDVVIGEVGRGFTFTGNKHAITVMGGALGTQIHYNHFCGNEFSGVRAFAETDARWNWWGHCSGPEHDPSNPPGLNPLGQGDAALGPVDFDPWLNPCPVSYDDLVCMDHVNSEDPYNDPEEFLIGSEDPRNDLYAVGFYNGGGEARLTSVSFQFYDPGHIKAWVYLSLEGFCPPCGEFEPGVPPFDAIYDPPTDLHTDSLSHIPIGDPLFTGTWGWERVDIEGPCIQIPSKRCFFIVWQQDSEQEGIPRILADGGHETTYSWIWNAEREMWKCYPGYEYMVKVCLDYTPGCLEIHDWDITWTHPQYDLHPCIGDPYTVQATFKNNCDEDVDMIVQIAEAPWGLFTMWTGYPGMYPTDGSLPLCSESFMVPAGGSTQLDCRCQFYHYDHGNAWARNIILGWFRNIQSCPKEITYPTGEQELCLNTDVTSYYTRKCRMTIWPDSPWSKQPVRWGLAPIEIPVFNPEGRRMLHELFVEDMPPGWDWDLSWPDDMAVLDPQELRSVYLTVRPNGAEPEGEVIIKVRAFKCNGEWGEVEIEFMPYKAKINMQPVEITGLWWSPRYPCHDTPYDVWTEVHNMGTESSYPKISFGLAPWGFFFPVPENQVFDTLETKAAGLGIGGGDYKIIAPYHHQTPFFVYHDQGCTDYQGYFRNIVIDYPVIERHCYTVEDSVTAYYRDCEGWMWPRQRWPWQAVALPIPVFNELPYADIIFIYEITVPDGWEYSIDKTVFSLETMQADTAWLSLIPGGELPDDPSGEGWPLDVYLKAWRSFCELERDSLHIKFLPFTGMCIPDYNGTIVEDPPGLEPRYGPGDDVQVSLMMENDYPVSAAQIDVHFDATYLEVMHEGLLPKVEKTTRTQDMQLAAYMMSDGHLRILIDSTPDPHKVIFPSVDGLHCEDAVPGGNLSIATVWFLIKEGAPIGHCTDITYGTVVLDGLPSWPDPYRDIPPGPKEPLCLKYKDKGQICFGGFVWPVRCDVTLDSVVSLVDLFSILRHIIGRETLPGGYDTPGTALWAADAIPDSTVNILDLMKCINKAIGLRDPKVVAPDVNANDLLALPGRTVSVPVEVSSETDVAGVMLRFSYDADVLSVGQPVLTERASGMLLDYGLVDGELMVLVSSLTGEVIDAGTGAVVRVPFEVAEDVEAELAIEMAEPIVFTAEEGIFFGEGSVVVLKVEDLIPAEFSLAQNYPNPFNPMTSIAYSLPEAAKVKVEIYNALGQVVSVLVDGNQDAGYHTVEWNADNLSSGVYFYRIVANDFTATKRMVLMK